MSWALVVHEQRDMGELLASILTRDFSAAAVMRAANLAEARLALMQHGAKSCRLIVSSASAPIDADQSQPLDRSRPTVPPFLQEARSYNPELHCVVMLSINESERRQEFEGAERTVLMGIENALELQQLAAKLLATPAGQRVSLPHDLDVEISLLNGMSVWSLRGCGTSPIEDSGHITIGPLERFRLLNDSRRASTATVDDIRLLGRDMYQHLVANSANNSLESALHGFSLESVRFRINVDQESSPMLVEMLAKPASTAINGDIDFWLRHTPIYRKFSSRGVGFPLFKDRRSRSENIDCLIIQGRAERFSTAKLNQQFQPIAGAVEEAAWIDGYLRKNSARFGLGEVRLLRPPADDDSDYGDMVRQVLAESGRSWRLVHYVGHSAIDSSGNAYLVLGNRPGELMEIRDFARTARHAQFVFLNSCSSGKAQFILKLVEAIPAVAGYAWEIDDEAAQIFARKFYETLFDGKISKRFLEYSFMHAKAHLHDVFQDRPPIWAAPLLFMQTMQAEIDHHADSGISGGRHGYH
jgi:hypothetical protein